MKQDFILLKEDFDENLETIVLLIDKWLGEVIENFPITLVLRVEVVEENNIKIWKGYLEETKPIDEDDIPLGHIEIIPLHNESATPKRVTLYSSNRKFMTYWAGLRDIILKNLKKSDVKLPTTVHPWEIIEDKGYDREMLKMWHEGRPVSYIAREIGQITEKTIRNKFSILRGKYGVEIVPLRQKRRISKDS